MGGAVGGSVASQVAVEAFLEHMSAGASPERTVQSVEQAISAANLRVWARALHEPSLKGMGTTLVALAMRAEREFVLAHVGDSRCYRFRCGVLQALTEDHSLVAEQLRMGVIGQEEAARSPMRNVITRALGTRPTVEPDLCLIDAEPGDLLLLCTDGLTREVPKAKLAALLADTLPLEGRADRLIQAALVAGGRDNVTVVLVQME